MTISQPTGNDIAGRLIDVSDLDKIFLDEIFLEDKTIYSLIMVQKKRNMWPPSIWKPVKSGKYGFTPLSSSDTYKLKFIGELVGTRKGMFFGYFNVSNLVFLFCPKELTNGWLPALNGMQNLYFLRHQESFNKHGEIYGSYFCSFLSTFGYTYRMINKLGVYSFKHKIYFLIC